MDCSQTRILRITLPNGFTLSVISERHYAPDEVEVALLSNEEFVWPEQVRRVTAKEALELLDRLQQI
jgi:hypothetical protein